MTKESLRKELDEMMEEVKKDMEDYFIDNLPYTAEVFYEIVRQQLTCYYYEALGFISYGVRVGAISYEEYLDYIKDIENTKEGYDKEYHMHIYGK